MRNPGWSTTIGATFGGYESANQNWSNARHEFDVSLAIRNETDYAVVLAHFHQMRGRAHYFPFKDFLDYRVEQSQGVLLDDYDSPTTAYQLAKRYGSGAYVYDRKITRPFNVAVYRVRAGVTTVITGSVTVSTTTGRLTAPITGHQTGDQYQWSGQFYVPCRYGLDKLPSVAVDRQAGGGELLVRCDSIPLIEFRE